MIYGLIAEFSEPEPLIAAAQKARERGYRRVDAFTPFPLHELEEPLRSFDKRVAMITLIGGIFGGVGGFFMQWFANVIDYPINIGGRPLNSWPAFIPVTFELTVLAASLAAAVGMLALNRLPCPHHPTFDAPDFARAAKDRFFLLIEAQDPLFERTKTERFLAETRPLKISEVPLHAGELSA